MKKKNLLTSIITTLSIIALLLFMESPIKASDNYFIKIIDIKTEEPIKHASIELNLIEQEESYEMGKTDENGYLEVPKDIYNKINNNAIYIQATSNQYYGQLVTNMNNDIISVEQTPMTRSSVDWSTYKTEFIGYVWIPVYRIPTYGGLKSTIKIGKSTGLTISGGGITNTSFSSLEIEEDSTSLNLSNSEGKTYHYAFAKVKKYKFYQQNGAGQKRTITPIINHIYELTSKSEKATFGNPSNVVKTISKGNSNYTTSFGRSTSFNFSLSGSLATDYGQFSVEISHGSSTSVTRTYTSSGTYGYEIGYDSIKRY